MPIKLRHYHERLVAEPSRVVIRPFQIAAEPRDLNTPQSWRMRRIVDAVIALSAQACEAVLRDVAQDFAERHWQAQEVFLARFAHIARDLAIDERTLTTTQKELIGAHFCHEYSYAAAAVMNPSIVPHVDQSGLGPGDQRFIMTLRTVGEGHISSIAFREGILTAAGDLKLWPQSERTIAVHCEEDMPSGAIVAHRPQSVPISGAVIFPFTRQQRNGLEDLRLVRFAEPGAPACYYGTYTAYSGADIRSELLSTRDFAAFRLEPMDGEAVRNKGMALFPRKIGGGYAMIGRQDGESLYFLQSDDLRRWESGALMLKPSLPWEIVQIGNCGAPIELNEGWLLLTHGVGAMRRYAIGAVLLDKTDPCRVLARLREPLLSPSGEQRNGYVPNVLYTCGALRHGDSLFIPYGIADSAVSFAIVDIASLLDAMN